MDPNFGVMPRPSSAVYPAGGAVDDLGPGAAHGLRRKVKLLTGGVIVLSAIAVIALFMVVLLYTTSLISSRAIEDGSVGTADLSPTGVTTDKLSDGAVTTAKVKAEAITTPLLSSAAVTTAKLENSAVTTSKIGEGAITADKLAASSVTSDAIQRWVCARGPCNCGAVM